MLHIITDFASSEGAQTMLARLLSISRQERITVVALQGVSSFNRERVSNPNVSFHALDLRSPLGIPAAVARLARIIRHERPPLILCWMYHAMALGTAASLMARSRAPVYWTIRQALDDRQTFSASTRFALSLCRRLAPFQSGIIYNSRRAFEQHTAFGFPDRNVAVIPNGFEIPEGTRCNSSSPRIFGIAARFHPQKDYENFLSAASRVARHRADVEFRIAGKGTTRENSEMKELIERFDIAPEKVKLLGPLEGMSDFYRGIDALVISSRTEGFPNVAAEAMSHGKIVITTDVGDAAEIVADTGAVVPPADPEALAGAIEWACELTPEQYRQKAAAARRRVTQCYALPEVYRHYTQFVGAPA